MHHEDLDVELTAEQEEEAARIEDILVGKARAEARYIARLVASKQNQELFGETEFQIRDAVHRIGAAGLDAALELRKKGGTKAPVACAPSAVATPGSTAIAPAT
jgi:hypothetical protein